MFRLNCGVVFFLTECSTCPLSFPFPFFSFLSYPLFLQILASITKLKKQTSAMKSDMLRNKDLSDGLATASLQKVAAAEKAIGVMRVEFPSEARFLLRALLGQVNVRLPHQSDRYKYKDEYESFKLQSTYVIIAACVLVLYMGGAYRSLEKIFHFILVNYYFVISVREHVLIQNGSNIRRWWRAHHYLAILLSAVMLTWPTGDSYSKFNPQFMWFSLTLALVQLMQHRYQSKLLYKQRALSKTATMTTTTDLPTGNSLFQIIGALLCLYVFQLYNSYSLYSIWNDATGKQEWQVATCGLIFFILSGGNIITTIQVVQKKLGFHNAAAKAASAKKK